MEESLQVEDENASMSMNLSENAMRVLQARYLRRDAQRNITETPDELFRRVARHVAAAEKVFSSPQSVDSWEEIFFGLLQSLEFLPNSPTLMNAGTPCGQLSACFVLPVEDTMESIFEAVKQMALIQRTGGGTGFSFSRLRPKNDIVESTGGQSSGPLSFMKIFDCATENIKQGGRRRGANMGILRVDHPDILEFIQAKRDETVLQNFNLSVGITDAFMEALQRKDLYPLIHPRTRKEVRKISSEEVFTEIARSAWQTGDPGLVFLDTMNRSHPTPLLGEIEATNPCGEIPLLPYESCNLGSINLSRMTRGPEFQMQVDWEKLRSTVRLAVRFLDNVIEVNRYPLPETKTMSKGNRKLGLGVMGFAELLILMGISYGSPDSIALAHRLMDFIHSEAHQTSCNLAKERGVFPHWNQSIYAQKGPSIRNATCTAIAPTGTIGIIADTSPSIEPLFALSYRRSNVLEGQTLRETNPLFLRYLESHPWTEEPWVRAVEETGHLKDISSVPDPVRHLFATALEISPEQHLEVQAAFQAHVDNSVSKTINLPYHATPEDISRIYRLAWEKKLKGITVFRYGSKAAQVLELGGGGPNGFLGAQAARCDPGECKL